VDPRRSSRPSLPRASLCAIGPHLPALLDVATILVLLAAPGLTLLMVGAMLTDRRRKEP
jgi:hypothetical protein